MLFDWGTNELNQEHYGSIYPPVIDLSRITDIPTAMFVGTADDLGDTTDAEWARDQIMSGGNALVHYEEVDAGHASFMIGKNMTYFDEVMNLVHTYNPIPNEFIF